MKKFSSVLHGIALAGFMAASGTVWAHGDVTPQAIDVSGLEKLGDEWREENPYRGNPRAIEIGASAYAQNCARCHGLDAISGGIAPDLRMLEPGLDGDEWFVYRVRNGAVRNGVPYMPKMADFLSQEGLWAIRAWLETRPADE
ncbi:MULTISPECIES: cytochrome c-550 PedF [unclassified Oceanobacter]|jgi:cytochrome c-550 PedF|uniref:cytochrome c-550 PedF n=1 Tax=unclassified Oceanobacter TaxID=2620260 RepID=UPI0026E48977|nr:MULTISPECIES: cytochrome c-550 PedF [unclassified Oceanobacter]MDO6682934.1 cytochrome c-550 PedF [Oceanobacter sp. 5_MG-2023]MDP2506135.1 cytochrome c-550 PedF [Oceanobacter sp. 3_MG-2023]MDP2547322.1 cytochrome c-550 PedF [Oceanobacter sp. 4_MG-2023]MDP2607448.1 cytochrome c-550 PedF [Oceanobacter sp. 1_MG-2023]MDP2610716.1 cytochrome c-550 PedF [Oceanobacter sp. 2_MG-2023]